MNVLEQSTIDLQLIALLDSLRKTSALALNERYWYDARRECIERVGQIAERSGDSESTGTATLGLRRQILSRAERKTIERILTAHHVDHPVSRP